MNMECTMTAGEWSISTTSTIFTKAQILFFSELLTTDKRDSLILHARKASAGGIKIENTHPFEAEYQGKKWFFCHNGTINDSFDYRETGEIERININLEKRRLYGDTDTEKYFYYILDSLDRGKGSVLGRLEKSLMQLEYYTSANGLLFNGTQLYVINKYTQNSKHFNLSILHKGDRFIVSPERIDIAGKKGSWQEMENGQIAEINVNTYSVILS